MNKPRRIMIFGRPGSGKSTFASWLSKESSLPLYHLDKYFYVSDWIERDYEEFIEIQQDLVGKEEWIIDGNALASLAMRWSSADLVIYLNFPRWLCYARVLKRRFSPNSFDDRAPGCNEKLSWPLLKYMWRFESRVNSKIEALRDAGPSIAFVSVTNNSELEQLKKELAATVTK